MMPVALQATFPVSLTRDALERLPSIERTNDHPKMQLSPVKTCKRHTNDEREMP